MGSHSVSVASATHDPLLLSEQFCRPITMWASLRACLEHWAQRSGDITPNDVAVLTHRRYVWRQVTLDLTEATPVSWQRQTKCPRVEFIMRRQGVGAGGELVAELFLIPPVPASPSSRESLDPNGRAQLFSADLLVFPTVTPAEADPSQSDAEPLCPETEVGTGHSNRAQGPKR
ncbi:hypothetical protein SKAU_G00028080 [Synaphobranchus kaupii]|uniref:Uncharacterized protein n=1 Tax=Synaphobranchus kaupii TaxID=118154 RepID=A0A9Q1GEF7_SYNKA|nr:hypothetical protein SKAU_G00028080 [Synaphobranchus kaupii]